MILYRSSNLNWALHELAKLLKDRRYVVAYVQDAKSASRMKYDLKVIFNGWIANSFSSGDYNIDIITIIRMKWPRQNANKCKVRLTPI